MTARAITCALLLVLPSCQIPSLRLSEPGPGLPANYDAANNSASPNPGATSTENSSQLGIEEFYNDPILSNLIVQGLVNNRELKALDQEVQVARSEIISRQGAYLPFLSVGARAGVDKPSLFTPEGAVEKYLEYYPGAHFPDPLPNFVGSLNLFWQLDIWRELRNARDAAIQRYFAASEKRNDFVTRLIAEIAENYYSLMALDKRLETLDQIIDLQQKSLEAAEQRLQAGRGNSLAVQRFQADVRRFQSEKLIVQQEIVETENRVNFRVNRFPQPVERTSAAFYDLNIHALSVGVPAQLLLSRPDIRQAERELVAAGIDIKVARARFFPKLDLSADVGYQSFNPKYLLMSPEALIYGVAGDLVAPLINKRAIQAEFLGANAKQLESVYNYQRVVLNAYTEVINRVALVENYRKSIELKKQQLEALTLAVDTSTRLFNAARVEFLEVLTTQRDLFDARTTLIETKRQQLVATANAYQALGGGGNLLPIVDPFPPRAKAHGRRWTQWFDAPAIPVVSAAPAAPVVEQR
ncbi:TolC family protein [Frigoriglobus tundricola]|uniref:TolC family protein n=1 Tax=Frigoriglobus tundricola TaxID=2774151 RepID=UPI001D05DEB1|nr:efflux transporter outer membrane subunit [Frigoriglobus tundricola]